MFNYFKSIKMETQNLIEIWKIIPNYPDYQISNLGNIQSLKFNKIKPIKSSLSSGKLQTKLTKNGIQTNFKISTLVAITFLNYDFTTKKVVKHLDNDKLNNRLDNLKIVSFRETCLNKINSQSKHPTIQRNFSGFSSKFRLNGKRITLTKFQTEDEAFNAYKSMTNSF